VLQWIALLGAAQYTVINYAYKTVLQFFCCCKTNSILCDYEVQDQDHNSVALFKTDSDSLPSTTRPGGRCGPSE